MHNERITIPAGELELDGALAMPDEVLGVILFINGGSNRIRPPNDYVASVLRTVRLGTLWLDLLSTAEAHSNQARNDVGLLSGRLQFACDWLRAHVATKDLPVGIFGAGPGAAAALQVGATRGRDIAAIVSRSGRPAPGNQATLGKISASTMLIVGGLDEDAVSTNRAAYAALRCKKRFEIIPGATHSFEEPGSLEVVARLARGWFLQHARFALV